jgi:intracellular multiplication protein IcmE
MSQSSPPTDPSDQPATSETGEKSKVRRPIFSKRTAVVGIGCVMGLLAIVIYANLSRSTSKIAVLPSAPPIKNIQGATPVNPLYAGQVQQVDKQNYTAAVQSGESSFPLPQYNPTTGTAESVSTSADGSTPPPQLDTQDASASSSITPASSNTAPQPVQTSNNAAAANAYSAALGDLLGPEVPQHRDTQNGGALIFVAANDLNLQSPNGRGGAAGAAGSMSGDTTARDNEAKYVPAAGTLIPAEMINGLNSDAPGPAIALILSGPLQGARVIGNFQTDRGGLVLKFSTMTIPINGGEQTVTVPIQADAISETGDQVQADVNNHFLANAAVTFLAGFGESMGTLLQQSGSTTINTANGESLTENPSLTLGTELGASAGGAVGAVGNQFQQTFGNRPPTIKIDPGTQFTLAFLGNSPGTTSQGGQDLPAIRPTVGGLPTDVSALENQNPLVPNENTPAP